METENSRQRIRRLLPSYRDNRSEYFRTAHSLARGLRSLRLSQDPSHLAPCENHITTVVGSYRSPQEPPLLEELLFLYPLRDLDYLGANLRGVYQDGGAQTYHGLLFAVRLVTYLLHNVERAAFGRIDPVGPGSQELSPPYTFIRTSFDGTLKALEKQIESVQILVLDQIYAGAGTGRQVLHLLESLSAPALTTLAFTIHTFDTVDCAAVTRVLKKHTGITCIIINRCEYFGKQEERIEYDRDWRQALDHNMREWGRNARSLGEFRYQVGIQGHVPTKVILETGEVLDNLFFRKEYKDMWIPDNLEVQVLVYVPCHGKITPALSGKTWDHHLSIDLIPVGCSADDEDFPPVVEGIHWEHPVPSGTQWQDGKIRLLPEVPRGYYKIAIHLNQKKESNTGVRPWSFEGLTVEFTPTPPSNETFTQTTGVTESLEAEMWATKDSAQDTTHTQPILNPHSDHSSISLKIRPPPSQSLDTAQESAERLQSGSPSPGIEGPVFRFLTSGSVGNQAARPIDSTYLRVGNDTPNGQPCS
ncbi:hypothetical protein V5O48_006526 [Marasmius crinis-equi]|uniref:Uncharacterized protein n=1 Tax=Marasmius crinis-equi TaxID=585013 RepID=A0ABR3FJL7_9AGAR